MIERTIRRIFAAGSPPANDGTSSTPDSNAKISLGTDGSVRAVTLKLPASHFDNKIELYSGGEEKIGTADYTIKYTARNYKFVSPVSTENAKLRVYNGDGTY